VNESPNSLHSLVLRIANIHLNGQSVRSMYQAMLDIDIMSHNIYLWKIKIPLKIKVVLWLLYRDAILTKDNLVKRN
jgi:hypothetical protein